MCNYVATGLLFNEEISKNAECKPFLTFTACQLGKKMNWYKKNNASLDLKLGESYIFYARSFF